MELYLLYDSEIGERFVQRITCVKDFETEAETTFERALRTRASDDPVIGALD